MDKPDSPPMHLLSPLKTRCPEHNKNSNPTGSDSAVELSGSLTSASGLPQLNRVDNSLPSYDYPLMGENFRETVKNQRKSLLTFKSRYHIAASASSSTPDDPSKSTTVDIKHQQALSLPPSNDTTGKSMPLGSCATSPSLFFNDPNKNLLSSPFGVLEPLRVTPHGAEEDEHDNWETTSASKAKRNCCGNNSKVEDDDVVMGDAPVCFVGTIDDITERISENGAAFQAYEDEESSEDEEDESTWHSGQQPYKDESNTEFNRSHGHPTGWSTGQCASQGGPLQRKDAHRPYIVLPPPEDSGQFSQQLFEQLQRLRSGAAIDNAGYPVSQAQAQQHSQANSLRGNCSTPSGPTYSGGVPVEFAVDREMACELANLPSYKQYLSYQAYTMNQRALAEDERMKSRLDRLSMPYRADVGPFLAKNLPAFPTYDQSAQIKSGHVNQLIQKKRSAAMSQYGLRQWSTDPMLSGPDSLNMMGRQIGSVSDGHQDANGLTTNKSFDSQAGGQQKHVNQQIQAELDASNALQDRCEEDYQRQVRAALDDLDMIQAQAIEPTNRGTSTSDVLPTEAPDEDTPPTTTAPSTTTITPPTPGETRVLARPRYEPSKIRNWPDEKRDFPRNYRPPLPIAVSGHTAGHVAQYYYQGQLKIADTNDTIMTIANMPAKRWPQRCSNRCHNLTSSANMKALLMQIAGDRASRACRPCRTRMPYGKIFRGCIFLEGYGKGACACCFWSGNGSACEYS